MTNPNLESLFAAQSPCFAMPASKCECESDPNFPQMLDAIQRAYYWLQHAHQLMIAQGISAENIETQWPTHLADAMHYCGEALSELDPE